MNDDPLLKRRPDDIVYVLSAVAGLFVTAIGGFVLWTVLQGAQFGGRIGRTINFADRLWFSVTILAVGLILLGFARWGFRRLRSQRRNDN